MLLKQKCPNCSNQSIYGEQAHFPFCSARCRDSDFLSWHDEKQILSTPITDADEAMDMMDKLPSH